MKRGFYLMELCINRYLYKQGKCGLFFFVCLFLGDTGSGVKQVSIYLFFLFVCLFSAMRSQGVNKHTDTFTVPETLDATLRPADCEVVEGLHHVTFGVKHQEAPSAS